MTLTEIHDFAWRFVPPAAVDERLYTEGERSWWPAHEIGHFLIATTRECRQRLFGLDTDVTYFYPTLKPRIRYVIIRELAAMSISQRILRRAGHVTWADQEIQYTDETTLHYAIEPWCRRAVRRLLSAHQVRRLPASSTGIEALLTRKARAVGTSFYRTRNDAALGQRSQQATA